MCIRDSHTSSVPVPADNFQTGDSLFLSVPAGDVYKRQGTGGGKTYFLLTIIEALLRTNVDLYILDPKNADLADLGTVMENVYHTKDDMIDCVNAFYDGMVTRSEEMKLHPNYRTGENYAYLGLAPQFLIFLLYGSSGAVSFLPSV